MKCEQSMEVFREHTHPDDSYNEDGTYWADLPLTRRMEFVNNVNNAETKKELSRIGRLMKADPLRPVS